MSEQEFDENEASTIESEEESVGPATHATEEVVAERTEEEQAQYDADYDYARFMNMCRSHFRNSWNERIANASFSDLRIMDNGRAKVPDDMNEVIERIARVVLFVQHLGSHDIVEHRDTGMMAAAAGKPAQRSEDDAAAVAGLLEEDDKLRAMPVAERARYIEKLLRADPEPDVEPVQPEPTAPDQYDLGA